MSSEGPLNPQEFRSFKVQEVEVLTHNTRRVRFELPADTPLNLPTASCLVCQATPAGAEAPVIRPYTPTTHSSEKGYFDLVVKVYPGGAMTQHIASLTPGDELLMKGPISKIAYTQNMKKHIGMIAGGTGITPMLQVIKHIINDPQDETKVSLVFANVSPQDILLHGELEKISQAHPNIQIHYIVNQADESWKGGVGYVNEDVVKQHIPGPSDDSLVMVCGPPPMVAAICGPKGPNFTQGEVGGLLEKLGYTSAQVFKF